MRLSAEWMPLSVEHALDGVNEEEAICGGLITKVIRKKKVVQLDRTSRVVTRRVSVFGLRVFQNISHSTTIQFSSVQFSSWSN